MGNGSLDPPEEVGAMRDGCNHSSQYSWRGEKKRGTYIQEYIKHLGLSHDSRFLNAVTTTAVCTSSLPQYRFLSPLGTKGGPLNNASVIITLALSFVYFARCGN